MKRLAVVHYLPLEFYPPAVNLLNAFAEKDLFNTKVWTTHNNKQRQVFKSPTSTSISRTIAPKKRDNKGFRLLKYLLFNFKTFMGLLFFNPEVILYYESYSAGPVYWYLKYFGNNKRLFIHCHEYFDAQWYAKGMSLVKLYHTYEKNYLYPKAAWISHTNTQRVALFLEDHPNVSKNKVQTIKNYPPKSWVTTRETSAIKPQVNITPIKLVYVGSLGINNTFIQEFCNWVQSKKGTVTFTIYAFNTTKPTYNYLSSLHSEYIDFKPGGIEYDKIPQVLSIYDIGVILYKGNTLNAKFCVSNKLFEYLACGLEVWVTKEQEGTLPYLDSNNQPRVMALDFENFDQTLIKSHKAARILPYKTHLFNFENQLDSIVAAMLN